MQKRHSTVLKALAGLSFGLALTATAAQAQQQVCVRNDGGFAIKIRVTTGSNPTPTYFPTTAYGVGVTKCLPLPEGVYSVQMKAALGGEVNCVSNATRNLELTTLAYYKATGTTGSPKCTAI